MNRCIFVGRLTRSPELKDGEHPYVRFGMAIDRKKEGADFINCVAFGKTAESLSKWCGKGTKIAIVSHVQTGSYEGKNGKVYTTDFIVDEWEFAQGKNENSSETNSEGFMRADAVDDGGLPWN